MGGIVVKEREFVNRKLHSLLGVIPVGLFLINHLVINNFATRGAEAFNKAAQFMEALPFRYLLEIFFIFLPLLYHAVYGLYIAFTAKNNATQYGFFRNWMFMLQRYTGVIALIFIVWHVWQTRVQAALGTKVNYDMMADILSSTPWFIFYLVGVLASIFHFANGLWSFFISWGITVSPRSQRISTYITMGIFVALAFMSIRTMLAFIDPELAKM
ncbi:succinate dehydrogenase cytochrome b558 subunit [Priestia taiwanensis]|uniref:succinate dehydrogenase cytochrome b558 subunit n=1 Tax=Priestia taiwanensis TaxID=1347902 RepID=UPI001EF84F4F|nr:succinate dehydrogenase cytochrome b558 subunit [Priestia taiwanensis]